MNLLRLIVLSIMLLASGHVHAIDDEIEAIHLRILVKRGTIAPKVIRKFEAENHLIVAVDYFNSNNERNDKLVEGDSDGYDLIMSDNFTYEAMKKVGWISNKPEDMIYWSMNIYGFIYKKELIKSPSSWKDFFDLCNSKVSNASLNKSTMVNFFAAKSLVNQNDDQLDSQLELSYHKVLAECDYSLSYESFSQFILHLRDNNILAAIVDSSYAESVIDLNGKAQFYIPTDPLIIKRDILVKTLFGTENKNSETFINFLSRRDIQEINKDKLNLNMSKQYASGIFNLTQHDIKVAPTLTVSDPSQFKIISDIHSAISGRGYVK